MGERQSLFEVHAGVTGSAREGEPPVEPAELVVPATAPPVGAKPPSPVFRMPDLLFPQAAGKSSSTRPPNRCLLSRRFGRRREQSGAEESCCSIRYKTSHAMPAILLPFFVRGKARQTSCAADSQRSLRMGFKPRLRQRSAPATMASTEAASPASITTTWDCTPVVLAKSSPARMPSQFIEG